MPRKNSIVGFVLVIAALIAAGYEYWREHLINIPASPSIVVLPAKVSGDAGLEFLTDAVANTLSMQLASISSVEMKAPPSSVEVDEVAGNVKRVAMAYGANLVVASAIAANADHFQLELQLLDPFTENELWRRTFDGSRSQYLDLIHRAAEGLRTLLQPSSAALPALSIDGGDEAELAFREGEYHLDRFESRHNPADFDGALKAYGRALEQNPKLADAAAGIARLYSIQIEEGAADPQSVMEVQNWTKRALDIDAHCVRAYFVMASVDPASKLDNTLRAATFAPDYAPAHLALASAMRASSTLALAASRQSRQTDALFLYAPVAEAGYLHQLGRTSEAFAMLDRHVLSIDPRMSYGRLMEASLMIELGWLERAEPIFKTLQEHAAEPGAMIPGSKEMRQRFAITQRQFGIKGLDVPTVLETVKNPKATPLEIMIAVESIPSLANGGYVDEA